MKDAAALIVAIAGLINAIIWPAFIGAVFLFERDRLRQLLDRLKAVELPGGIKAELGELANHTAREVEKARGPAADRALVAEVTNVERTAAERVERIVAGEPNAALESARVFGRQYERTRASMSAGNVRTRAMEQVVVKMRTLAFALASEIDKLVDSDSPGERLAAIAAMQLEPRPKHIGWLGDRFSIEQPFVRYHAAIALLTAVRVHEAAWRSTLENAIETGLSVEAANADAADRKAILSKARDELRRGR